MFVQRLFRVIRWCTTWAVLMLVGVPIGKCETASEPGVEQSKDEVIDEIVVYGEKSLNKLRRDQDKAQDKVFALFNTLNSDDEFDVLCTYEAPIGSHIKERFCEPNFLVEMRADALRDVARGQYNDVNFATIFKKEKELQREMKELAVEHPDLREALSEFAEKKQHFESEYARKCEGRFILCRK